MPWVVTLKVVSCASPSTFLAGASITDGNSYYYTDANGQFIAVVDDAYSAYLVQISKAGYLSETYTLSVVQNGTSQTTCLNTAPAGGGGGGGGTGGCFIVTAATGSASSEEVLQLRQMRDRVTGLSRWSGRLIEEIYREYEQFSPAIAACIEGDWLTRETVRRVVVRPLVAWYALAGKLALDPADRRGVAAAAAAVAAACPRSMGVGAPRIAAALTALRSAPGSSESDGVILGDLGVKIRAALKFERAAWAIFDPLVRAWSCGAEAFDIIENVGAWLGKAPLESVSPEGSLDETESELATVSGFLAFYPEVRRELGRRLLAAWPQHAGALERQKFL